MTVGASVMVESSAGVPHASKKEQQVLLELLAVLKGAPSEIIRYDERNGLFQVAVENLDLGDATVHLVRSIAETGWLYAHHIRPFMQPNTTYKASTEPRRASSPDATTRESRTRSALRSAFAAELQAYHATLDQAERLQLQGRLTLPQLSLLMEPHRSVLLRWLAMISDALRDEFDREKDAARILDLLWRYRSHGDAAVRQLVDRLFSAAFIHMNLVIISWVTCGDLMGAENEYFIRLDERGFPALVSEALPTLIPQLVADRIFQAGLSRFLYRKWAKASVLEDEACFSTPHAVLVDAAVVGSTTKWMQRLDLIEHLRRDVPIRDLFLERFRLLQQLEFHRMFVLLENSDFAGHLIDKLEPLLSCKTSTVERSYLVRALIEALALSGLGRSVWSSVDNTQDCLDVYLVDPHTRDRDCIADAFMLTYAFPEPIHYLLRQCPHFSEYQRLYNVAWRLRLAEHQLDRAACELARLYQDLRRWAPTRMVTVAARDPRSWADHPQTILGTCALFRSYLSQCVHAIIRCLYAEIFAPSWRTLVAQLENNRVDPPLSAFKTALDEYFRMASVGLFWQDRTCADINDLADPSTQKENVHNASSSQTRPSGPRGVGTSISPSRRRMTRPVAQTGDLAPAFSAILLSIRQFIALCQGICLRLQGRVRALGYSDPTSNHDDLSSLSAAMHRLMRQWNRLVWPQWRRALDASSSRPLRQLAETMPPAFVSGEQCFPQ